MTKAISACPLMGLTTDSLLRISNNLDVRSANILSQTCKTWRDMTRENHLLLRAVGREKLLSLSSLKKLKLRDFDSLDLEENQTDKQYFQIMSSLFDRALSNESYLRVNPRWLFDKEKKYITNVEIFDWEDLQPLVKNYCNIERMKLNGYDIKSSDPNLLSQLKRLKYITLFQCVFTDEILKDLFELCNSLTRLEIYINDQIRGEGFSFLSADCLANLKSLSLRSCKNITNENMLELLARGSSLEYLEVGYNENITFKGFDSLPKLLYLKTLVLSDCCKVCEIKVVKFIQNCPNLQRLEIKDNNYITGQEFEKVPSGQLSKFKSLCFSRCKFLENKRFVELCLRCSELEALHVSSNDLITGEGFDQLRENLKIKSLTFSYCKNLMDLNLMYLLLRCLDLEELILKDCELISGKFVESLPKILKIKSLVLNENSNLTNENMIELFTRCPNLKYLTICQVDQFTAEKMDTLGSRHFYNLERLSIYDCENLDNRNMVELLKRCPNLKVLVLIKQGKLTGDGFDTLNEFKNLDYLRVEDCKNITNINMLQLLKRCGNLRVLKLFEIVEFNGISKEVIEKDLSNFSKLKTVKFRGCTFDDEMFIQLLKKMNSLEKVSLSACKRVSICKHLYTTVMNKEEIRRFITSFPNVSMNYDQTTSTIRIV